MGASIGDKIRTVITIVGDSTIFAWRLLFNACVLLGLYMKCAHTPLVGTGFV
jgi:hypothetical protein